MYQNVTAHFKHSFPTLLFISVNIEQAASMTGDIFMFPPRSLLNMYRELWVLELFTGLPLMGRCYTQISFNFWVCWCEWTVKYTSNNDDGLLDRNILAMPPTAFWTDTVMGVKWRSFYKAKIRPTFGSCFIFNIHTLEWCYYF